MNNNEFSLWLKGFLESEGVTVGQVADVCKVTTKSIYDWLRARGPLHPDVTRDRLERWAAASRSLQELDFHKGGAIYPIPPGVDPEAWDEMADLFPRLSQIFESQAIVKHSDRWGWIRGNIETFSDIVRADVEALRKERKKARGAG